MFLDFNTGLIWDPTTLANGMHTILRITATTWPPTIDQMEIVHQGIPIYSKEYMWSSIAQLTIHPQEIIHGAVPCRIGGHGVS